MRCKYQSSKKINHIYKVVRQAPIDDAKLYPLGSKKR